MKKILSIIAFAVLAILLSVTAFAADSDIVASGYCGGEGDGKNLTWSLTEDGTLTISGEGAMADYGYTLKAPWKGYKCKQLIFEEGITTIGIGAFSECSWYIELAIPNSVISIGNGAFSYSCFKGNLVIPENVKIIGNAAFLYCSNFTGNLIIPDSVTTIGDSAFTGCFGFDGNLILGKSINSIGNDAFYGCKGFTGNLIIPESVTSIYICAFEGCSSFVGDLNIPNNVIYIGENAFLGCSGLNGNITIGKNVETIENGAFLGVKSESIIVEEDNENYCSVDGILYTKDKGTLITCPGGKNGSLEILDGVTTIKQSAFTGCSNLTGKLVIPESVLTIEDYAFSHCYGFTGITIGKNVTNIGYCAFSYCTGFSGNLKIPDSVKVINGEAFYNCSGFNGSLVIGNNVTEIGVVAFKNCSGFTGDIILPGSIENIGVDAFSNCGINDYYFKGNAPKVTSAGKYSGTFDKEADTIYYPDNNPTWEIVDGKWNGYTAVAYSDEPDAALSISSAKGISGGGTKTVSIILSENSNAAMAQFAIKYDSSALELVSASAGELMKDALVNTGKAGTVFFGWDSQTPVAEGGTILELTFKTAEDAKPGEYPIEIDTSKEFVFSRTDSSDLNIEIENGKITVIEGVYGDLNGDGKVNIKDAYFARLVVAKLIKPTEEQILLGDVDLDGKISAIDANILRKYSVQIIEKLPVS